jgi:hypothetical protein
MDNSATAAIHNNGFHVDPDTANRIIRATPLLNFYHTSTAHQYICNYLKGFDLETQPSYL